MEYVKGKFSVILPYYNGRKYIQETVDSILAQTYKDFELLLIDDGSPNKIDSDFLVSLVEAKKDARIKYCRRNNSGLSETRNFGINSSDGEFIAFIDQDDLWDMDKLQLQAEVFAKNADVKFICTDGRTIGETNQERQTAKKWGFKTGIIHDTFSKLMIGNFVACSTVAFRRAAVAEVGYSSREYSVVPDYEYFFRFSEKMDFYFIAKSLFSYRIHGENTSKQLFRGACEQISVLFARKPRTVLNRVNITINFLRYIALIWWLWLKKLLKRN